MISLLSNKLHSSNNIKFNEKVGVYIDILLREKGSMYDILPFIEKNGNIYMYWHVYTYKHLWKDKQNISNSGYSLQRVGIGRWGIRVGEGLLPLYNVLLFSV